MALDRSPGPGSTSRLGNYELLKEISGGGVGSTWLARPLSEAEGEVAAPVTIFRLYRHLTKKSEVADGVLREARVGQKVRAPNVLAVLDARIVDGEVLVVSEYAEGEPLAALLASAGISEGTRAAGAPVPVGLPQPVALRIAVDVLRALSAAHAAAPDPITHGELNPQHIRVGVDGCTRVSGFGVARVIAGLAPMGGKSHDRLSYAAPERVKAMAMHVDAAIDPRSDLFSVGVLFWEVLARQRLFTSKLEAAIIQKVLTAPIAPLASLEGIEIPAAIDAVIQKALERDPARRFASADQMIAAIQGAGVEIASKAAVAAVIEKLASKAIEAPKTMSAAPMIGAAAGERPVTPRKRGTTLMGVASPFAGADPARGGQGSRLAITAPAPRPKGGEASASSAGGLVKDTAGSDAAAAKGATANGSAAGGRSTAHTGDIDSSWETVEEKSLGRAGTRLGSDAPGAVSAAVAAGRARAGINAPAPVKPGAAAKTPAAGQASAPIPVPRASRLEGSDPEPPPASGRASARKEASGREAAPSSDKGAPTMKPSAPPRPQLGRGTPTAAPRAGGSIRAQAPAIPDGPAARKAPGATAGITAPGAAAAAPGAAIAAPGAAAAAPGAAAVAPGAAAADVATAAPESSRTVVERAPISGLMRTHTPTPTGPQGLTRVRGRAASAVDRLGPGSSLGRYEILMPVAQGGMAAVWAARLQGTRGFQKIVAVKTMLPDVSDDPDFQTMFLDEARVAARIRHPNVAEILDLGEEEDVLYLVMEWVDGETLSTLQKAAKPLGGIPQRIALRIASQICAGLHNAHELRDDSGALLDLVHRDVSPANVLISTAGFVKIVDFGVAKSKGRLHVTRAGGVIKGKTPYLSPEQLGGLPIDRRSDIFSLGALLYVLTTGLHPFRGETEMTTVENIALKNPISPREINESLHPDFERIIQRALEKDRARRFSTCAEMQRALDQVASTIGEMTTDEDVADFVRQVIGDIQAKRAQDLRDAIAAVDANVAALSEPRPSAAMAATATAAALAAEPAATQPQATAAAAPIVEPASGKPALPGARAAPAISSPEILDEISFEEDMASHREVVHPPKLIIAPSARPPPPPAPPAETPGPEVSAARPVGLAPHALGAPALAGVGLAPRVPDVEGRRKWLQRIVLGIIAACIVLGAIALVAGLGAKPPAEDRAGTAVAPTSGAEPPPAKAPEPPPAKAPEPPSTPPIEATAAPSAPDPLAEPPSTPPPVDAVAEQQPAPPLAPPAPPRAATAATTTPPLTASTASTARTTPKPPPSNTTRTPPKPPKKKYDPTGI